MGVEKNDDRGGKALELVPVNRPITIQDLMTQTSGIVYGFIGEGMVQRLYEKAKIYDGDFDNAEFADASRGFRWRHSRVRCGTTATPPTFSDASSRSYRENRFSISSRTVCSARSA